jgi:hypothetical protein
MSCFVYQLVVLQLLLRSFACVQSAPNDVGEWQERLGPRGVWDQGEGDAGGVVAGGFDSGRDERSCGN